MFWKDYQMKKRQKNQLVSGPMSGGASFGVGNKLVEEKGPMHHLPLHPELNVALSSMGDSAFATTVTTSCSKSYSLLMGKFKVSNLENT